MTDKNKAEGVHVGVRGVMHKAAQRIMEVKQIHSSNMAVHMPLHAQMDAVVHAASTSGAGGAWLKMLREAGLDFWTAFVRECIKVHDFSEAQLCLSLSRSPRPRYLHCLAVWPASCPLSQQTAQRLQRLASRSGLGKITKYIKCDIE